MPLTTFSDQLADLTERAVSSVVSVHGRWRNASSGFVWRPGIVVTAEETLDRDEDLAVTLPDGNRVPAELAGRDPGTAIAILKIPETAPPSLPAGDMEALRPGHVTLALGRREGHPIVALGVAAIVAGSWRSRRGGTVDRLIRLDVTLDREAEGGPVLDTQGRLIGMSVFGPRRRTLVIPAITIDRVAEQLLARGRIPRGYLGLGLRPVRLDPPHGHGAIVVSVDAYGPGRRAGFLLGDVIVAWDGTPLSGVRDALSRLGPESVGRTVNLDVLRAGAPISAALVIGERPAS